MAQQSPRTVNLTYHPGGTVRPVSHTLVMVSRDNTDLPRGPRPPSDELGNPLDWGTRRSELACWRLLLEFIRIPSPLSSRMIS
jgi:hypothetical protein